MKLLRRHPVLAGGIAVLLVLFGVVVATAVAVWRAAHNDEARRIDHVDVIMVLGAAQYSGIPSPVFRARLDHAALLYRQGRADRILVLGAGQPGDLTTEAEAGTRYLTGEEGVAPEVVVPSPIGGTSFESLRAAAAWMSEEGLESAFLVSDPWHNLRIRRMARDLGIEAYVSATFHSAAVTRRTRAFGYVRETFAYLGYRLFGA